MQWPEYILLIINNINKEIYAVYSQIEFRQTPTLDLASSTVNNISLPSTTIIDNHHHHPQQFGTPRCHRRRRLPLATTVTAHNYNDRCQPQRERGGNATSPAPNSWMTPCHVDSDGSWWQWRGTSTVRAMSFKRRQCMQVSMTMSPHTSSCMWTTTSHDHPRMTPSTHEWTRATTRTMTAHDCPRRTTPPINKQDQPRTKTTAHEQERPDANQDEHQRPWTDTGNDEPRWGPSLLSLPPSLSSLPSPLHHSPPFPPPSITLLPSLPPPSLSSPPSPLHHSLPLPPPFITPHPSSLPLSATSPLPSSLSTSPCPFL